MTITARKLKNGKTVYDVCVSTGKDTSGKYVRVYETAYTKADAKRREAELIAEYRALSPRSGSTTLAGYIDTYYWPSALKRLSPTSLDTYDREIRNRIKPILGHMKLKDIDRPAIQAMVDSCKTAGTAKCAVGVLKTILNEAVSDNYIVKNPATAKFAYPLTASKKRDNGLVLSTFAQIRKLLDIVDANASICVQRIAYTGLLLGLRPEERYALDWSCFDLFAETVTITQAYVTASAKHGGVQMKDTKTKRSTRTIPMHPDFYSWILNQPKVDDNAPFILGANGQRISPSTAQKRWRLFLAENPQCPPVTIENMRHSFATAYLAAGGQIEVLSRILGHSNISTTINRYYRPDVELLRSDLQAISQNSRINAKSAGQRGDLTRSILRASTTHE